MEITDIETKLRRFRIFESGATPDPLDEILELATQVNPSVDSDLIIRFHQDLKDIFAGFYPGYKENGNRYHNLRHTFGVVLAATRLFHGLSVEGHRFSGRHLLVGLLCAYFHDTGLLLRSFDTADTGAEFTKYHEARSISSLFKYIEPLQFDDAMRIDCGSVIRCTNLDLDIDTIEFSSAETRTVGQVLGTADILAQMADRYYLEQLEDLFQEHRAGGLQAYDSAFELMQDTTNFYRSFISRRLRRELGDISHAMLVHFRHRWNLDRDLYLENIENNIKYLEQVVQHCRSDLSDLGRYLRRRPPLLS